MPDFPKDAVVTMKTTVPPVALTQEPPAPDTFLYCNMKAAILDTLLDPSTSASIMSNVPQGWTPSQTLTLGGPKEMPTSALSAAGLRVVVHVQDRTLACLSAIPG